MAVQHKLVLAGIDGSLLTPAVCGYAAWIAQKVSAPLKLLHTIDHHPETAPKADLSGNIGIDSRDHLLEEITALEQQRSKLRLEQGKRLLQTAKEQVSAAGVKEPMISLRHGGLIETLIELENDIRVLVLGVRGKIHENQTDKIGAKLEAIIRSLHKPILVVNGRFKAPERIMIAYDGSEAAEKALDMVANSPLYQGLSCHLVCVSKDDGKGKLLARAAHKLELIDGIEVIAQKLMGKPDHVLCGYQADHGIDMTVMGAFGQHRIHEWLLGSFTVKMLTQTKNPLLLLR